MLSGFKKFILRGNVLDLAVGVVIGAAFNSVVQSLVKDFVTPLIGIIGKVPGLDSYSFTVNGSRFLIGDLLNSVISFLITAAAVYFCIIVPMNLLISRNKKSESIPTTKKCPECLSEIPVAASRCAHCTTKI